jgi:hypothetical protein
MLKSSKFKSTASLDDSKTSATSSPAARGGVFSRLINNRKNERRDQRDQLMNQNRVLSTPKTVSSSTSSLSTKKPTATPSSNVNGDQARNKSVIRSIIDTKTSILSKFPTRKPALPTPQARATTSAASSVPTTSGEANNTYVVGNDPNMSTDSLNCSTNTTIAQANRRKVLEQWLKEKRERDAREKQLKGQKPVFKVGSSFSKPPPGLALPTSAAFNFHVIHLP